MSPECSWSITNLHAEKRLFRQFGTCCERWWHRAEGNRTLSLRSLDARRGLHLQQVRNYDTPGHRLVPGNAEPLTRFFFSVSSERSTSPNMQMLCPGCGLTRRLLHCAQWTSLGVYWRFWVWCATQSPGAHRPLTTKTAGFVSSRGFSSTSRSPRGEERSFWGFIRRRPRWHAAAPAASWETVSYTSLDFVSFLVCVFTHSALIAFLFL